MKRLFRKVKYDLIIYLCLFCALVLVGYSSLTYFNNEGVISSLIVSIFAKCLYMLFCVKEIVT